VTDAQIPLAELASGVKVRVICGETAGVRGPITDVVIDPQYFDVDVPPETELLFPTPPGHTVLVYVIAGEATFCESADPFSYEAQGSGYLDMQRSAWQGNTSLLVFDDGDQIKVHSGSAGVRFLFISGKPIREPVAWYGPIVMNTESELRVAFEEYQNGTFLKKKSG
jgi:quercetin 2,3-dioxygenase